MKKNIALVTGGYSGESVISYKTATTIGRHLDSDKYNVYLIDISRNGWWYVSEDENRVAVDLNNFTISLEGKQIVFDAAFIAIHGTPGEDGKLQGYFDMLQIPYTSCDAATSAITFNKRYTVAVAGMAGISVAPSVHLFKDRKYDVNDISESLKFPVFVKPNNGGSSIGMSRVNEPAGLKDAIEKAFGEDSQVLVEQMINGREFTVGVYSDNGNIKVLPVTEIISQKDFFDYEAKYEGASKEVTPAEINQNMEDALVEEARKAYEIFNCRGVVRIDFIYSDEDHRPYMLELNTVPGQSEASIIPQQVRAAKMDLREFYTKILEDAFT